MEANDNNDNDAAGVKIPKRAFGQVCGNQRLPPSVSMVGLGCSSFSSFFYSAQELDDTTNYWTVHNLQKTHPRVQEWIATIEYAVLDANITVLDTAPWYGHGTSEIVIGFAIEQLGDRFDRNNVTINTKVGRYEADPKFQFDFSGFATLQSVARSLKRMKIQFIDVLQMHDVEFCTSIDELLNETIPAILVCQQRGWCRALGMTGYPLQVQHQILERSMQHFGTNVFDQALTYGHYNLHNFSLTDRPLAGTTMSFAEYCHEKSILMVAAAPLSMGLLTHNNELPEWHPASPELRQACSDAASICKDLGVDIATLALVVALSNPKIPCTVLGMRNIYEVKIVQSVAARFRDVDEGATVEEILDNVLTDSEKRAWEQLRDVECGPFASVWESGAFRWDGVKEARDFWKQLGRDDISWQCDAE